ncbi:hypothetical protein [Halomicrobium urmianum]|nr:hypothetical protein [Halomicrobium urmianum]
MNKFQHVKLFADDLRRNVRTRTAAPARGRDADDEEESPAKVFPAGF